MTILDYAFAHLISKKAKVVMRNIQKQGSAEYGKCKEIKTWIP